MKRILLFLLVVVFMQGGGKSFAQKKPVEALPDKKVESLLDALKKARKASQETYGAGKPITGPLPGDVSAEDYPSPMPLEELEREAEKEKRSAYEKFVKPKKKEGMGPPTEKVPVPSGVLTQKEIQKLKEKALEYRKAINSPPRVHRGRIRFLAIDYSRPQQINTAVGYATVLSFPFDLRAENPVVIGDSSSFTVTLLSKRQIVLFPKKPFWCTNLVVFPKEGKPLTFFVKEVYDSGEADYYIECREQNIELSEENLLNLAQFGKFKKAELNGLLSPRCKNFQKTTICELRDGRKVLIRNGEYECIKGCTLWINASHLGKTIAVVGNDYELCETTISPFAERRCIKSMEAKGSEEK